MATPRRQTIFLAAAVAIVTVAAWAPALAQGAYPNKPIHIVVPYPAGGTTDQLARAIQQPLQEQLGQPIIIENKAGAAGSHLTSEYFNELAGTKFQHIPYAGGAPLVTAFAGGQVQLAFVTGLDGAAMVQAGKIRYLGVASPQRTEVLPGLPAIAEAVPVFSSVVWFGVLAPRGVPDDIAAKLNAAIVKAVARPEVRKLFVDRNVEPHSSTPAEMEKTIQDELDKWGPVIKKADIKA